MRIDVEEVRNKVISKINSMPKIPKINTNQLDL